jgi:hypothetical protein
MLHLAQVQKNSTSGNRELQILACQIDKSVWKLDKSTAIPLKDFVSFPEGALVLLDKNPDNNTINNLQPAKDWILNLVQKYLTKDAVDSQLLAAEQSKIEQWRQEITVQNLELNRQFLEIETRREQLQELEQSLKHDREQLQLWAASLQQKQSEMMEH